MPSPLPTYPLIITGYASAKKGDSQLCKLAIVPDLPFPTLKGDSWTGLASLNKAGHYQMGTDHEPHLPQSVNVYFLRSDAEGAWTGNRTDQAGYPIRKEYGAPLTVNKGALVYRGESIGEVKGEVKVGSGWKGDSVHWTGPSLTEGARKWLAAELDALIVAGVADSRDVLNRWTFARIEECMKGRIASARAELDKAEEEMDTILGCVRP